MFDGVTIFREPKDPVPIGTPVPVVRAKDLFSLDICFRLLKDVEGIYLIPDENCPFDAEKLDELTNEQKCSMFWIQYSDHEGNLVTSEKKAWIKDF